jgi:dTDP-4-dehydrorhamnose reductase
MKPGGMLVFGAAGDLGSAVVVAAREAGWEVMPWTRANLDLAECDKITPAIEQARPDVVVNCAAMHRVEDAQGGGAAMRECYAVNVDAVKQIAIACGVLSARLVQISTDYVFDGTSALPYYESDPPCPENFYGLCKWQGELQVAAWARHWITVRTSALFGGRGVSSKGGDFPRKMLARADRGEKEFRVRSDLLFSATHVKMLAEDICRLLAQDVEGFIHITNSGVAKWSDLAVRVFEIANVNVHVEATAGHPHGGGVRYPHNSVLRSVRNADIRTPYIHFNGLLFEHVRWCMETKPWA